MMQQLPLPKQVTVPVPAAASGLVLAEGGECGEYHPSKNQNTKRLQTSGGNSFTRSVFFVFEMCQIVIIEFMFEDRHVDVTWTTLSNMYEEFVILWHDFRF